MNKFSIKVKVVTAIVILIFLPAVIIANFSLNSSKKELEDHILEEHQILMDQQIRLLNAFIDEYTVTTKITHNYPPVQGLIRAEETGVDPYDNSTTEQWKERLEVLFQSKASYHKEIIQIRYIDEKGNEVVRINSKMGNPEVVNVEKLQNKADRYYFTETMKLLEGEIYISEMDLNVEEGEIEIPYVPTIRISIPIFNEVTGSREGLLILNLNTSQVLSNLKEPRLGNLILIDNDGYFLSSQDESKEFGWITGSEANYFKEQPKLRDLMNQNDSGIYQDNENSQLVIWKKVYYRGNNNDFWVLISTTNYEHVFSSVYNLTQNYYTISVFWSLSIIAFVLFARHLITKPILDLSKAIDSISAGNFDVNIKGTDRQDEIGVLAKSFDRIVVSLKLAMRKNAGKSNGQSKDQNIN